MSQVQSEAYSPICPICHEPVRVEEAKTDEDGQAIHEDCYFASLKHTLSITQERNR
jgi:hypothetical protein